MNTNESSWKPSEGQLECLEYAINNAEKDYSPLAGNRIYLTLKALKKQLEKIKNENIVMEDYKEKYEHGLECIQEILSGAGDSIKTSILRKRLQPFFPELKESEDERIRKGILYMFEMALPDVFKRYGINKNDAISYIEKLKDFDKQLEVQYNRGYDAGYIEGRAFTKEELEKQDEQKVSVDDFKAKNWYVSEVDGKIHDMTYNPADNVESKFKVGDWITNSIETVQITGYDIDYGYQVDCKGNLQHRDTDIIEKEYHLWTIQDAKEGDVLACCGNKPFIFKGFFGLNFPNCLAAYCGVTLENQFGHCNGKTFWTNQDVKPATKEQCNLLFQKMHEAGYEWDAEKNELKKIEFNPDGLIEESYQQQADDLIDMVTEKSTWSEEDERLCQCLINDQEESLNDVRNDRYGHTEIISDLKEMYRERINWLKSIKDRIQPQPKQDGKWKWEEDDEKFFKENILIGLGNIDSVSPELYSKIIDWINLIKKRLS